MPRRVIPPDETLALCRRASAFVVALTASGIEIPDVCSAFRAATEMAVVRQCLSSCLDHRLVRQFEDEDGRQIALDGPLFEKAVRDTCAAHSEDAADPLEEWGLAWDDFVGVAPMLVRCLRSLA